ncbi:MAG TPA: DUF2630 family protein [Ktedonobacterales bacterium]|jgi:hypothetical protein
MDDNAILHRITALVNEEHGLDKHGEQHGLEDEERQRLQDLQVMLDQCWDLLRQRRARRSAGQDPDQAEVRPSSVVEHYRQ